MRIRGPVLLDIKRTLRSKSVLVLMVVLIVLSATSIPNFAQSGSGAQSPSLGTQVFTYYDLDGYHFLCFAWNTFGQPLSGITFHVNVTAGMETIHTGSGDTNSSGETEFVIPVAFNATYSVSISILQPNGQSIGFSEGTLPFSSVNPNGTVSIRVPPGDAVGAWGNGIAVVGDSVNASKRNLHVTWVGKYGDAPTDYMLYYTFVNQSLDPSLLNEANMHVLGNMDSFQNTFASPPVEHGLSSDAQLIVAVFYPNGTRILYVPFAVTELYPAVTSSISITESNNILTGFFQEIFGFLIPLVAIIQAYNSYGRDRISGVLDSVLVRPVSRLGLSLSKFISSFIALSVATLAGLGIDDIIAFYYTKSFVSSTLILPTALSLLVELGAFVGIVMLLSHVVRSSVALIGIGIGLFILFDFFWGSLVAAAAALFHVQTGTSGYFQILIASLFVNPAQFMSLVYTYLTHDTNFVGFGGPYLALTPSAYGITIVTIIIAGGLWVAIPLTIFLYLAVKRD